MYETAIQRVEIFRKLQLLEKYAERLKSKNFASTGYVDFAEDISKIVNIARNNLSSILDVHLRDFSEFIDSELLACLSYLEKSTSEYIPWSLLPELESICKDHGKPDEKVILKCEYEFKYSVHNIDVVSRIVGLVKRYTHVSKDFDECRFIKPRILTVPFLERTNVLLHAIIFHEVGHYREEEFTNKMKNEIKQIVGNELKVLSQDLFDLSESYEVILGAVREMYADVFAFAHCGLPYLFALRHSAIWHPSTDLPRTDTMYYPPLKYRIRKIFEVMESWDIGKEIEQRISEHEFFRVISNELESIRRYLEVKDDITILDSTRPTLAAKLAFEKVFKLIVEETKNTSRTDFPSVTKLYDNLINLVPPCQLQGRNQPMEAILNAGWAAYYQYMNDDIGHEEQAEKLRSLNLLCLKAISQSSFLRLYSEHKDNEYTS